jgi:hypothetical protein
MAAAQIREAYNVGHWLPLDGSVIDLMALHQPVKVVNTAMYAGHEGMRFILCGDSVNNKPTILVVQFSGDFGNVGDNRVYQSVHERDIGVLIRQRTPNTTPLDGSF